MLEYWVQGCLAICFPGVPTVYQCMVQYYEDEIVA